MVVLIARSGRFREHVFPGRGLPYSITTKIPARFNDVTGEMLASFTGEFHKVGLTDSFGRPIYVQRW